jgi:hypothetical protein
MKKIMTIEYAKEIVKDIQWINLPIITCQDRDFTLWRENWKRIPILSHRHFQLLWG